MHGIYRKYLRIRIVRGQQDVSSLTRQLADHPMIVVGLLLLVY